MDIVLWGLSLELGLAFAYEKGNRIKDRRRFSAALKNNDQEDKLEWEW